MVICPRIDQVFVELLDREQAHMLRPTEVSDVISAAPNSRCIGARAAVLK
jgi:hypothetical protein